MTVTTDTELLQLIEAGEDVCRRLRARADGVEVDVRAWRRRAGYGCHRGYLWAVSAAVSAAVLASWLGIALTN